MKFLELVVLETVSVQTNDLSSFKNKVTNKSFDYESKLYKQDLALDNPQGLICHKTPNNQPYRQQIFEND